MQPEWKHPGTLPIQTPRLLLRRFTTGDAPAMFRNWASDPQVTRCLSWAPHKAVTDTKAYLQALTARYRQPDTYDWCMEWKETGEPIGSIGAVRTDGALRSAHVGYCMARALWGRGIMTEALAAVEDFLFARAGCNRIASMHHVENPVSGRVMQKTGMRLEGIQRQAALNNRGEPVDIALYAILRADWEALGRS